MTEEKILRLDKPCYVPMDDGEQFIVKKSDSYKRYKKIMADIDIEQKEIDDDIKAYWEQVKELDEQGHSLDEIKEIMAGRYSDEEH